MLGISLVQLVAAVVVLHQPCPVIHGSCYDPATTTIYASGDFALLHEYGHAWDYQRLSDAQRTRYTHMLGYSRNRAWWHHKRSLEYPLSEAPAEQFASAYARCALGYDPDAVRAWSFRQRRLQRLCATLPASVLRAVRRRA